jgi:DNA-directed RNA polymerase subunit RPC12/RpoP
MSWFSQSYWCEDCGREIRDLFPKSEVPDAIECECGGVMEKCMAVNVKPQTRSFGVRKPNNIGNRVCYHQQSGTHYTSWKELDEKNAAKGMFPVGNRQESIDWVEAADTEGAKVQERKRKVTEYRQYCERNGINPGGEITKVEKESLKRKS